MTTTKTVKVEVARAGEDPASETIAINLDTSNWICPECGQDMGVTRGACDDGHQALSIEESTADYL